jgi:hypothetical protein
MQVSATTHFVPLSSNFFILREDATSFIYQHLLFICFGVTFDISCIFSFPLLEIYSDLPSSTTYCATIWNLLGENVSKDHAFNYVAITNNSITLKRTIVLCSCYKYEQPIYIILKRIMLCYSYWGADDIILIKNIFSDK